MLQYTIYQLPGTHPALFLSYDYAKKNGGVNMSDYQKVYSGEIPGNSENEILEKLYMIFNVNHPEGFTGHSLSISDIVELEGKGFYFCDTIGWVKIANK